MIELDGRQFNIKTPEENVGDMLAAVNNWCSQNDIRNRKDELVQIEANWANPLYVMMYGFSYLVSALQNLIHSAAAAFSIQEASEQQLLNIADIAGVKRKQPTKTTIQCVVYATTADCRITTGLSVTVPLGGQNIIFHPAFDITIPANEARSIILVCETYGSYSISASTIAGFDENPENMRSFINMPSTPGQEQETIRALRQRLQRRLSNVSAQDLAMEAISQLDGVSVCNIYINESVVETRIINGVSVPPRNTLIYVQGYSEKIAATYWSQMSLPVAGGSNSEAISQIYTTRSGQEFPVYIFQPTQVVLYVRLYFNDIVSDTKAQSMRDTIALLAANLTIGQRLTSTEVVDIIQANFTEQPAGCQLSLDNEQFGYQVTPGANELIIFNTDIVHIGIISADS